MWQCVKCHAHHDDHFPVSRNCGTARDGTEDPDFRKEGNSGSKLEPKVMNPVPVIEDWLEEGLTLATAERIATAPDERSRREYSATVRLHRLGERPAERNDNPHALRGRVRPDGAHGGCLLECVGYSPGVRPATAKRWLCQLRHGCDNSGDLASSRRAEGSFPRDARQPTARYGGPEAAAKAVTLTSSKDSRRLDKILRNGPLGSRFRLPRRTQPP
jgi:hypothetical protein